MDFDLTGLRDARPLDLRAQQRRKQGEQEEPRPMDLPSIKHYMKQLLEGVAALHKHSVIHRDLKGANILVNRQHDIKIADFGLGRPIHPNAKAPLTNQVVTLWYRAPELLLGERKYGPGIDMWSCGCLLAELMTGKPLFVFFLLCVRKSTVTRVGDDWKNGERSALGMLMFYFRVAMQNEVTHPCAYPLLDACSQVS